MGDALESESNQFQGKDLLNDSRYIREVQIKDPDKIDIETFPFNLELFENFRSLKFHPEVTFLIGENGSGKSTLVEAIALALGFNAEGGTVNYNFSTCSTHSSLSDHLRVVRGNSKPRDGFFLRAESFYNLATYTDEIDNTKSFGEQSLHHQSHGESFMSTLEYKLRGNGLYIMDEPEAALSPTRQMTAISYIHDLVMHNSQFIIATHSPILLAYPRATIYELRDGAIREIEYEATEHFKMTKEFLNRHQQMIKILTEEN